MKIAYDGTEFCGWQRQGTGRTVQAVLEKALAVVHKAPVALTGSGRTDAGVHAAGQTANFYTPIQSIPAARFVPALNRLLPRDVRVLAAAEAAPDFHARFDARSRTYRYHFVPGRPALPSELRYAMQLWRVPDLERLNACARLLVGERDCSLFAAPREQSLSRGRHISRSSFFYQAGELVFEITANAFLWRMVRCAAGTMLRCAERGPDGADYFQALLSSGDHARAGPVLPPEGLFLWQVDYYR